jgi:hypothetical protein
LGGSGLPSTVKTLGHVRVRLEERTHPLVPHAAHEERRPSQAHVVAVARVHERGRPAVAPLRAQQVDEEDAHHRHALRDLGRLEHSVDARLVAGDDLGQPRVVRAGPEVASVERLLQVGGRNVLPLVRVREGQERDELAEVGADRLGPRVGVPRESVQPLCTVARRVWPKCSRRPIMSRWSWQKTSRTFSLGARPLSTIWLVNVVNVFHMATWEHLQRRLRLGLCRGRRMPRDVSAAPASDTSPLPTRPGR